MQAAKPAAATSTKDLDAAKKLRDEAKAKLEEAEKLRAEAEKELERAKLQSAAGSAVSPKELQDAKTAIDTAQINLDNARCCCTRRSGTGRSHAVSALVGLETKRIELQAQLAGNASSRRRQKTICVYI